VGLRELVGELGGGVASVLRREGFVGKGVDEMKDSFVAGHESEHLKRGVADDMLDESHGVVFRIGKESDVTRSGIEDVLNQGEQIW
jgi:hypothetical protein